MGMRNPFWEKPPMEREREREGGVWIEPWGGRTSNRKEPLKNTQYAAI